MRECEEPRMDKALAEAAQGSEREQSFAGAREGRRLVLVAAAGRQLSQADGAAHSAELHLCLWLRSKLCCLAASRRAAWLAAAVYGWTHGQRARDALQVQSGACTPTREQWSAAGGVL